MIKELIFGTLKSLNVFPLLPKIPSAELSTQKRLIDLRCGQAIEEQSLGYLI